ncbi:hypothetical protein [Methylobacterium sp. SI9]|uniref:hypothetical protein n=1 Tax=Methylobacterium guangdongense TaxID=3138811 RepID=UPI00313D358F
MNRIVLAALALVCACVPTLAAEVVTKGSDLVVLPGGDWIQGISQTLQAFLVPLLTGFAISAVARVAPALRLLLTDRLIQSYVEAFLAYGVNAVVGATKGMHLDVHVGSQVLAEAIRRAMERADVNKFTAWVIKLAGGHAEVAKKIFRAMHLDDTAGAANVLDPLLEQLEAGTFWKPAINPVTKVAVVTRKPAHPAARPAARA